VQLTNYFGPQLKEGLGISSIKARTNRLLSEYPKCLLFLILALCIQFAILYYDPDVLSILAEMIAINSREVVFISVIDMAFILV
jgi:hypothetical protein